MLWVEDCFFSGWNEIKKVLSNNLDRIASIAETISSAHFVLLFFFLERLQILLV